MTLTVGLLNQADLSSRFFQYPYFLFTFWAGYTGMDYLFTFDTLKKMAGPQMRVLGLHVLSLRVLG